MELAAFIALGAIAAAITMWVYFDAMELGKPAVGWALAQPLLGWMLFLPLVLYVIFREHGPRRIVAPDGAQRQLVYIFSFVGFGMAAFALSVFAAYAIMAIVGDVDQDDLRETVASCLALAIFGLLLWAFLWFPAVRRLGSIAEDDRFRATFYLHRGYAYTVIVVSLVIAFLSGLLVMAGLFSAALGVSDLEVEDWLSIAGPLAVALLAIGIHYSAHIDTEGFRELQARFESIPPPPFIGVPLPATEAAATVPSQPASSGQQFCSQCGQRLAEGQRFCPSCGTPAAV